MYRYRYTKIATLFSLLPVMVLSGLWVGACLASHRCARHEQAEFVAKRAEMEKRMRLRDEAYAAYGQLKTLDEMTTEDWENLLRTLAPAATCEQLDAIGHM